MENKELFDVEQTIAKPLFKKKQYPWEVIIDLDKEIISLGKNLSKDEYDEIKENVWVSKQTTIHENAIIDAPAIIGKNTELRPGAWIRGNVIIGNNCIIGNSTEVKNSILFNYVGASHFNYIGDSIIGYNTHLGAGSITSNIRLDRKNIKIKYMDKLIDTNMLKLGAVIGDNVEIGCHCVINPGTIIGRGSIIYPLVSIKGNILENSIIKNNDRGERNE